MPKRKTVKALLHGIAKEFTKGAGTAPKKIMTSGGIARAYQRSISTEKRAEDIKRRRDEFELDKKKSAGNAEKVNPQKVVKRDAVKEIK